ncbi:peptidase [Yeosuana aromativorans]|uniref:Peptidase n=1 Tax=Yeosuana aromativorans TaxID=288019 RepID=A0A8J3FIN0_9FLAO|nr:S41 family peptidase [Yeosuana aromativorans]GGK30384.1 peptidase [Yeosuana aromativorans]
MKKKYKYIVFAVGLLILKSNYSCHDSEPKLSGIWSSVGYGKQMIITDSTITLYDTFSGGCALFAEIPPKDFNNISEILNLTHNSLKLKVGLTVYEFTRTNSEIPPCSKQLIKNDPLSNFDALWNTFNENYSSFDVRNINWGKIKERYRPMLSVESSDVKLYSVLSQMISELNDGHVFLDAPDSIKNDPAVKDDNRIGDLRKMVISQIDSTYIDKVNNYNKGNLIWGTIDKNIGYIQINNFEDLANYNISDSLSEDEFWEEYWKAAENSKSYTQDVLVSFDKQMSSIMEHLKSTEFCIIDVRFNNGGFDQAGLIVLSYFTNQRILAYTKKAKNGTDFTQKQAIYIDPKPINYSNPIYILTSHQTASASETFVLGSLNLPKVKRIGSSTAGVFSNVLDKRLPNGWHYGLSNEIYESPDHKNYEMVGIKPDYIIDYEKSGFLFYKQLNNEIETGDVAIEKAVFFGKNQ